MCILDSGDEGVIMLYDLARVFSLVILLRPPSEKWRDLSGRPSRNGKSRPDRCVGAGFSLLVYETLA